MVTMLTEDIPRLSGLGDLRPGQRLSLSVQLEGRPGRLVVAVQGFEELPQIPKSKRTQLTPQQLWCACDAMRDGLAEPVRLSTIASLVGLSSWQFSRSFH